MRSGCERSEVEAEEQQKMSLHGQHFALAVAVFRQVDQLAYLTQKTQPQLVRFIPLPKNTSVITQLIIL